MTWRSPPAGSGCAAPARPAGTTGSSASRARCSARITPGSASASGPQPTSGDLADYVLAPFTREEHDLIDPLLDPMADAAESWLTEGIERAMTRFNRGS